jgi:hypothetical protein
MYNWQTILNIILPAPAAVAGFVPLQVTPPPIYGQVKLTQVQAHARVYMAVKERYNQTLGMLYTFLNNLLDATYHYRMDISPINYTINSVLDGV